MALEARIGSAAITHVVVAADAGGDRTACGVFTDSSSIRRLRFVYPEEAREIEIENSLGLGASALDAEDAREIEQGLERIFDLTWASHCGGSTDDLAKAIGRLEEKGP